MLITQILDTWAHACEAKSVSWSLYRETLLCAHGYPEFPPSLTCANVAIPEGELPPLPEAWEMKKMGPARIAFLQNGKQILTLDILPKAQWPGVSETRKGYPVIRDHCDYLADRFGDYENGLTDSIGCGLTAREKAALKEHQKRCVQALRFVQELSREKGLRYYLLAGSVLGAVRHGGFIPWDDDIDIGIRAEDRDVFEKCVKEALPRRLPEGFTLMQCGENLPYPRMFSKICYEGRCCIDLWPLVPTRESGPGAKFTWVFSKIITKVHYRKIGAEVTHYAKPARLLAMCMTDGMALRLARHNERKGIPKNLPAYINLYSVYSREKETIKRIWLDTPATAQFEGIRVPVVGCTDAYLTHLYGDYMTLPAPWNRGSRHFERFN